MADCTVTEEWRPIPDWESLYSVSNLGRVRRDAAGQGTQPVPYVLTPRHSHGYRSVSLHGHRRSTVSVHRLVALAFLGLQHGQEVNHKNGDKTDNHAANLECVSHRENMQHAREQLGIPMPQGVPGEKHWNSRLTEAKVLEIRAAAAAGETHKSISRRYGIAPQSVSEIVTRRKWPHVA